MALNQLLTILIAIGAIYRKIILRFFIQNKIIFLIAQLYYNFQIYLDTTNQQVAFRITNALSDGYVKFTKNLLSDCDLPLDLADPPVRFNEPIYGSASPNFTEFMAPGIIIIIIFFLAVALTGEAYITEKMVR